MLLVIAAAAGRDPNHAEQRSGLKERAVIRAIHDLIEMRQLSARKLPGNAGTGYLVHILDLVPLATVLKTPPEHAEALFERHHHASQGTVPKTPPQAGTTPRAPASESNIDSIDLRIDRVLTAKAQSREPDYSGRPQPRPGAHQEPVSQNPPSGAAPKFPSTDSS